MKTTYKEYEVPTLVSDLKYRFEEACLTYRQALESRSSNRAKKELVRDNTRGTNMHKFQVSFSWIIHDIQTGPRFSIVDRITEAVDLIDHIIKISNS